MLIENVTLLQGDQEIVADIELDDAGIVRAITPKEAASSLIAFALMSDLNATTTNEVFTPKSLKALSKEALLSGVGHIALRPFGSAKIDSENALASVQSHLHTVTDATIHPSFCATIEPLKLSNISLLLGAGGIAPYIYSDMDTNLMRRVMQYAQMKKVAIFCELKDSSLNADSVMHDGRISTHLGLVGNTPLAEIVQLGKVIEMARNFDVEVVVKGISTVKSLEKIVRAKASGVKIHSEVSIHHLLKSDEACLDYNTYAKIEPPLRDTEAVQAMLQALIEGKIDMLTALHAPKSKVAKGAAFALASYGTVGFNALFSLYYTKLVASGLISLSELAKLTVTHPSQFIPEASYAIEVGKEANFFVIDKEKTTMIEDETSLYHKEVLEGKIRMIYKDGKRYGFKTA